MDSLRWLLAVGGFAALVVIFAGSVTMSYVVIYILGGFDDGEPDREDGK